MFFLQDFWEHLLKKHLSVPTKFVETISTTNFLRQELSPALEQHFFNEPVNIVFLSKRLLEMSSVAENNRIIPATDKLDN